MRVFLDSDWLFLCSNWSTSIASSVLIGWLVDLVLSAKQMQGDDVRQDGIAMSLRSLSRPPARHVRLSKITVVFQRLLILLDPYVNVILG